MPSIFVPIPGVARFELIFMLDGQRCENVYHVQHAGEWTVADLNNMCAALKAWWTTHMQAGVSNSLMLVSILGTDQAAQDAPRTEYVTGLPLSGLNTDGTLLPNNVAIAVKWLTDQRGRSFRGRTYHMGLRTAEVNKNTLLPATAAGLQTVYESLITAVSAVTDCKLVVASRYHLHVARNPGIATPITACAVEPTVDSQRRRLPGRGK